MNMEEVTNNIMEGFKEGINNGLLAGFKIILPYIVIALIIGAGIHITKRLILLAKTINKKSPPPLHENTHLSYADTYRPHYLFTSNEKDAFHKIKSVTDKLGLYLFAKVRLFDLIEPTTNHRNYMAARGKIQSKHVDFVICDSKLVARTIIELDDNSHNTKDRRERDEFVDAALKATGYKVIRLKAVIPEELELLLTESEDVYSISK